MNSHFRGIPSGRRACAFLLTIACTGLFAAPGSTQSGSDTTPPTASNFIHIDSNQTALPENLPGTLVTGVTAQLTVQDTGSGLAVGTATFQSTPYGVLVS